MNVKQIIIDSYHQLFNKRLNDPVWLIDQVPSASAKQIAETLGCSEQLVRKKINKVFETPDRVFSTYTGFFHNSKWLIYPLIRKPLKKIQQGIDSVYPKTKSRNATIFKDLILELEIFDDDKGDGNFIMHHVRLLGMSRKAMYLLMLKFLVCLYEYDNYYAERADYFLKRVLDRQAEIYLDEQAKPENWHPHRNIRVSGRYMILRNRKHD